MPIQWSGTIESPQELASVIQGEAGSNPAGQFAVASVIYNRLQAGNFGSSLSQVVTPTQFNGFKAPDANAQSLANDLWSGNAPSGGTTGNALYFSAPTANEGTSVDFGTSTNIGGNYFSDQYQSPPSANFQAPVYTGNDPVNSVTPIADGTAGISNSDGTSALGLQNISGGTTANVGTSAFDINGVAEGNDLPPDQAGLGSISSNTGPYGDLSGAQAAFSGNPTSSATFANPQVQSLFSDTSGAVGSSPIGAVSALSGGGIPIQVTDISGAGQAAANTVNQGLNQLGKAVAGSAQAVSNVATNLTSSFFQAGTDWLIRGGLFLLAAIILLGAWFFFLRGDDNGKIPVIIPA